MFRRNASRRFRRNGAMEIRSSFGSIRIYLWFKKSDWEAIKGLSTTEERIAMIFATVLVAKSKQKKIVYSSEDDDCDDDSNENLAKDDYELRLGLQHVNT